MLKVQKRLTGKSKRSIEFYINKLDKDLTQLAVDSVSQAGDFMYKKVIANASRKDYTLSQLKGLNHPFAKRHGQIMGSSLGGDFVSKPWMVHKREGNFVKNIYKVVKTGGKNNRTTYRISYNYGNPNVRRIVRGTQVMEPRNVIGETYNFNKKKLVSSAKKELSKVRNFSKSSKF